LRSSTSSGANYEEACGAESKADFIHKMQLVLKELGESLYWLRLIKKASLISDEHLQPLLSEAKELVIIVSKSIITAKRK
jgi:four helix bundle protein